MTSEEFQKALVRWAQAEWNRLHLTLDPTRDIPRLLRDHLTQRLGPGDDGTALPADPRIAHRPPQTSLYIGPRLLYSGLAYGTTQVGAYTGLAAGDPLVWGHDTWCPADATIEDAPARPSTIPATNRVPGMYSGRMRTIVQRMLGAGVEPPWGYGPGSCAWIYTSPADDSEWIVELTVDGVTISPLAYDNDLTHECDSAPSLVPIGRGPILPPIASAEDVEPYFATMGIHYGYGFAASESGVKADNLTQSFDEDGYMHVHHWRIEVSETAPGLPDHAELTKVSDSLAWSLFPGYTQIPASWDHLMVWDFRYGMNVEPAEYPTEWPVHVHYVGETLYLYTRTDVEGEASAVEMAETWEGATVARYEFANPMPADPAEIGRTYQTSGTRQRFPFVRISGPDIDVVDGISEEVDGTYLSPKMTFQVENEKLIYEGTNIGQGSIYELSCEDSNYTGARVLSERHAIAMPCGDREALLIARWTSESHGGKSYRNTVIGNGFLGSWYAEVWFPYWVYYPDDLPSGCGAPYLVQDNPAGNVVVFSNSPGPEYIYSGDLSSVSFTYNGASRVICREQYTESGAEYRVDIPLDYVSEPAGEYNAEHTVTLLTNGVAITIDSGESSVPADWTSTPTFHSGGAMWMLRNAEGGGVVTGDPRWLPTEAFELSPLSTEYRDPIDALGPRGMWVGNPENGNG